MVVVGYDFDGVFHKSVSEADAKGERHYLNRDSVSYLPFQRILERARRQLRIGYRVLIISARPETDRADVKAFLEIYRLGGIQCIFTAGQDKSQWLAREGVNEYYDDSCLRITQLCAAHLPQLQRLYLVYPETETWTMINCQVDSCPVNPIVRDLKNVLDQAGSNYTLADDDHVENYLRALYVFFCNRL